MWWCVGWGGCSGGGDCMWVVGGGGAVYVCMCVCVWGVVLAGSFIFFLFSIE